MIVVATEDFELYHEVVSELRDRGVTFTTLDPGESLPDRTRVLLTTSDEVNAWDESTLASIEHVTATADRARQAVEEALSRMRGGDGGRTVIGVDPGTRPGIAVLSGEMVVAAFHVPLEDATEAVREEVADAVDPLVRIGDGARLQGATIINDLEEIPVELVDETGTTPYLGTGARGMGDVLAAVNIARLAGERVESRAIEPTPGELQTIKNVSRERSETGRTISEELARRVAAGELTVEEALEEHRGGGDEAADGSED